MKILGKGLLSLCALFLVSGPAFAGYFGLSGNQNTYKGWDEVGQSLDDGSFNGSDRSEDTDNGFRLFGGFGDPASPLSFEIGYADFGQATWEGTSDGSGFWPAGPMSVKVAASGLDFGAVAKAKVSESVGFFGRIGVLKWDVDADANIGGGAGSSGDSGTDLFYGLGFEVGGASTAVRLDYSRYTLGDDDLDSLSLSLILRLAAK